MTEILTPEKLNIAILVKPMTLPFFSLDWRVKDIDPWVKVGAIWAYFLPTGLITFELMPKLLGLPTPALATVKCFDCTSTENLQKGPIAIASGSGFTIEITILAPKGPYPSGIIYEGRELSGVLLYRASCSIPPFLGTMNVADATVVMQIFTTVH